MIISKIKNSGIERILAILIPVILCVACVNPKKEYEKAKKLNTLEAYENFLKVCDDSEYEEEILDTITNIQERTALKEAKEKNDFDAYVNFLKEYPNRNCFNEAQDSIINLLLNMKIDDQYISQYSYSKRYMIDKFVFLEDDTLNGSFKVVLHELIQAKIDSFYNVVASRNSLDNWQYFIDIVPLNYQKDAQARLDKLAWGTDEKAWKTACERGTKDAYQTYLEMYPNGKYVSKAINKQVDAIFSSDHGELPSMTQTSDYGGSTAHLRVKNSTSYVLTILYAGPQSKRVVIPSKQTTSVSLKSGHYKVAAIVNAANVIDYAGNDDLKGGDYESEFYIETSRSYHF